MIQGKGFVGQNRCDESKMEDVNGESVMELEELREGETIRTAPLQTNAESKLIRA